MLGQRLYRHGLAVHCVLHLQRVFLHLLAQFAVEVSHGLFLVGYRVWILVYDPLYDLALHRYR